MCVVIKSERRTGNVRKPTLSDVRRRQHNSLRTTAVPVGVRGANAGSKDYLQVFELKPVGCLQSITHSSEEPEYHMEYLLPLDTPIKEKLYIIDDGDHSTMLLASEY